MRIVTRLIVTVVCLAATTGSAWAEGAKQTTVEDRVIAKVNSRSIYLSQVKPAIDVAQGRFRKYGASGLPDETRKRIQTEELDRQIAQELLFQAGDKLFGQVIDKKVEEVLSQQSPGNKIAAANSDSDATRSKLRRQLLIDEYVLLQGARNVTVPEADLKKYYDQNAASFKETASIRVLHILVKLPPTATPEEVSRSRSAIETIRTEILNGKDFSEVARQYSDCSSAKAGGDLGYIKHKFMPQEFDAAAFALKDGALSDVVRTRHGLHLIKVVDRKPERIPPFSELRDFIEKHLSKEAKKKKVDEIVRELRSEAKIELFI